MANTGNLDVESSAVQAHLTIMQGVIQRMAENSRSCKVWCVTLVAATLVLEHFRVEKNLYSNRTNAVWPSRTARYGATQS